MKRVIVTIIIIVILIGMSASTLLVGFTSPQASHSDRDSASSESDFAGPPAGATPRVTGPSAPPVE